MQVYLWWIFVYDVRIFLTLECVCVWVALTYTVGQKKKTAHERRIIWIKQSNPNKLSSMHKRAYFESCYGKNFYQKVKMAHLIAHELILHLIKYTVVTLKFYLISFVESLAISVAFNCATWKCIKRKVAPLIPGSFEYINNGEGYFAPQNCIEFRMTLVEAWREGLRIIAYN